MSDKHSNEQKRAQPVGGSLHRMVENRILRNGLHEHESGVVLGVVDHAVGQIARLFEQLRGAALHQQHRVVPGIIVDDPTLEVLVGEGAAGPESGDVDAGGLSVGEVVLGGQVGDDGAAAVGEVQHAACRVNERERERRVLI